MHSASAQDDPLVKLPVSISDEFLHTGERVMASEVKKVDTVLAQIFQYEQQGVRWFVGMTVLQIEDEHLQSTWLI